MIRTGRLAPALLLLMALATSLWAAPEMVPAPKVTGQQWSVVVIPDTQNYTMKYGNVGYVLDGRYDQQTQWIADNVKTLNIRFAAVVGDSVQHGADIPGEWQLAVRALNLLHEGHDPDRPALVPYAVACGNHDYDKIHDATSPSTNFEKYLGPGRFRDAAGNIKEAIKDWYGGDDKGWQYTVGDKVLATGVGRNSWQTFRAADREYLCLNLEMATTDEGIAWARTVLAANPGKPTIVSTHAFIDPRGRLLQMPRMFRQAAGGDNPSNDAAAMFQKLVAPNDQIFLVLCGHVFDHAHAVFKNAAGHDVQVFLQCYHGDYAGGLIFNRDAPPGGWPSGRQAPDDRKRNGSGWLTVLVFDPAAGTITHYTYSPVIGVWAGNRPRDDHKTPDGTDGVWWNHTFPEGDDVFQVIPSDFQTRFPLRGGG